MLSSRRPSSSLRSIGNDENASIRKTMGGSRSSSSSILVVNDENAFGLVGGRSGKKVPSSSSLSSRKTKKVFGRDYSSSSNNAAPAPSERPARRQQKSFSTTPATRGGGGTRRRALGDISNRKQNGSGAGTEAGGKREVSNQRDVLGVLPIKGGGGGVVKTVPSKTTNTAGQKKSVSFRKSNDGARDRPGDGGGRRVRLPFRDSVEKRSTDKGKRSDREFEATSLSDIVSAFDDDDGVSEVEDIELPAGRLYGEGEDFWRDEGPVCSFDLEDDDDDPAGYFDDRDRAYQLEERERVERADAAHRREMEAFLAHDDDDWNALVKDVGDRIVDFPSGDDDSSFGMSSSFGLDVPIERRDDDFSL